MLSSMHASIINGLHGGANLLVKRVFSFMIVKCKYPHY